jgi:hypothetical protein
VLRLFQKQKGAAACVVRLKQVVALGRLCPEEEESRVGPCGSERKGGPGWADREAKAQWRGGERAGW